MTPRTSTAPGRIRFVGGPRLRGIALLTAALLTAGCAADSSATTVTPATTTTTPAVSTTFDPSAYAQLPPPPAPPGETVECHYTPGGPATPAARFAPVAMVSTVGVVKLNLETTIGPVPLVLERAKAPCTVNSFINLARQGFFNKSTCDELVNEETAQVYTCGDPTGTGSGGPGYRFADEYPVTVQSETNGLFTPVLHPRGTLAMASDGRSGFNGSRFLLIFGDTVLPKWYTIFGTIGEAGLPLLADAADAGYEGGPNEFGRGRPINPVMIERVI